MLKKSSPLKQLGQMEPNLANSRSKSNEGHYDMWHTALWSCTHIPNIIDRYGKTKKLWSGQVSLRRSRRKNQTILDSDWSISKKSSPLKLLSHMNRNLVRSIYMYGRICIKFPQSRMKGERHRLSPLSVHMAKQFQRRRFFRNRPIRNKNCMWWPCLLTDQDEMSNLHRGHSIDDFY
jgi:hypothetical protein